MVDEGQVNKNRVGKRGRFRKPAIVLRWVWTGVLSILLLASIFYHAPWKVMGLIAVFLLAGTVLPRRRRRYFWAAVALTVLALTLWVFLPDDSKGWRPYVFEKETEAFLARYRVPAEENAALVYASLCRQWEAGDPNEPNLPYDWYDKVRQGPWRSDEYPEIAAWLDYHKATVARLMEATRLERCFFENNLRRWLLFPPSNLPHLAPMRQLAFLLEASANRDWAEQGLEAAVEKQLECLRFGEHLSSQPDTLHVLVGQAVESLALKQLNRAILDDAMDAIHLELAADAVASIRDDWRHTFEGILECDKLYTKNLFSRGMYQVNAAGRVRRSRDPWAPIQNQMESVSESNEVPDGETQRDLRRAIYPGYWQKKAYKAWMIASWFASPSSPENPEKVSEMIDKAYEKYTPMLDPAYERHGEPQSVLSIFEDLVSQHSNRDFAYAIESSTAMQEETYDGFHDSFRRTETARRGTCVMVALRRYKNTQGSWPRDLEAARAFGKNTLFVDAWDRPFVYRLDGDSFRLYSTGANGLDENGRYEVKYSDDDPTATTVADDLMIYPSR